MSTTETAKSNGGGVFLEPSDQHVLDARAAFLLAADAEADAHASLLAATAAKEAALSAFQRTCRTYLRAHDVHASDGYTVEVKDGKVSHRKLTDAEIAAQRKA